MIKVLANDGISQSGIDALTTKGFDVITKKVNQEDLIKTINAENYEVLLVRSATNVRKDMIDACPNLKIIGRGGVGMDNIDVEYARKKGINVINTPTASSASVAELVFAHLFGMVRFLFDSNKQMPLSGDSDFKGLKKSYSSGRELAGKTLGIIGFGRIGQEVAKRAIGLGMEVKAHDKFIDEVNITLKFFNSDKKSFTIQTESMEEVLRNSDFITLHIPKLKSNECFIDSEKFSWMKPGTSLINTARGSIVSEDGLYEAIKTGRLQAAFDVFWDEPYLGKLMEFYPENFYMSPHVSSTSSNFIDGCKSDLDRLIKEI